MGMFLLVNDVLMRVKCW